MKDEKEPLEQKQNSEEEEYSFLQEIIKDEAEIRRSGNTTSLEGFS